MRWEVIKKKVASEAFTASMRTDGHNAGLILVDMIGSDFAVARKEGLRGAVEAYADQVYKRIMNWDVRAVGRLRELFPEFFPPSLAKGGLVAFMDDEKDSEWVVERKQ